MGTVRDQIEAKLQDELQPDSLTVTDDSHLHAGHAGARPGGESHFTVDIVAERFARESRVGRHRLINTILADELAGPIHALAIKARAPGE
ncbi:BolA family protein [Maricaulis sp. D1M11]|uniref:BolA family protein n=1 Tax=Maricaulis sp. D1M11 TaxID=3076117 RepID=UPI0039B64C83